MKKVNSKGRMTFSFSLDPELMKEYKKHCDENAFAVSKRLEILIRKEIGFR